MHYRQMLAGSSTSWATLSKAGRQSVNAWMSALDAYNNGLTGPGHCQ